MNIRHGSRLEGSGCCNSDVSIKDNLASLSR